MECAMEGFSLRNPLTRARLHETIRLDVENRELFSYLHQLFHCDLTSFSILGFVGDAFCCLAYITAPCRYFMQEENTRDQMKIDCISTFDVRP